MEKIASSIPEERLKVVAICQGEISKVKRFSRQRELNFPILHDPDGIVKQKLGVRTPTRILINSNYEIIEIVESDGNLNEQMKAFEKLQNLK